MALVRMATVSLLLVAAGAQAQMLKTADDAPGRFMASMEVQGSSYKQENLDWNEMKGNKVGLAGRAAFLGATGSFFAFDARLARGKVDIDTGNSTGSENDRLSDVRALAGRRLPVGNGDLTPYIGLGWLRLVNETDGLLTTGAIPVNRRIDSLRYVALGVDWGIGSQGGTRFELNAEFDHLLRGRQKTEFPGLSQDNTQNYGHGLRGSLLIGFGSWAIGPFASRWKVKTSNDDLFWFEPETTTTEAGVRIRYTLQ